MLASKPGTNMVTDFEVSQDDFAISIVCGAIQLRQTRGIGIIYQQEQHLNGSVYKDVSK